ncbi:MAG: hypothetical protein HC805_02000 [Alkalinema sp. RL_2_19]|nr:hypothetical protein [Alkalinema sp. RL_2_19]
MSRQTFTARLPDDIYQQFLLKLSLTGLSQSQGIQIAIAQWLASDHHDALRLSRMTRKLEVMGERLILLDIQLEANSATALDGAIHPRLGCGLSDDVTILW